MSKNKSTESVNKIEWPTDTHFTMDDLFDKYPKVIEITLRFRVKKAEEAKEVVLIGKVKPPIGRPRKVYTVANAPKEVAEKAFAAGVLPLDAARSTVPVGDVKAKKKVAQATAPAAIAPATAAEVTVPQVSA